MTAAGMSGPDAMVLLVEAPGDGGWCADTETALTAAGIVTRRVGVAITSQSSTGAYASGAAAIEAALRDRVADRVVLAGAGYAATAIAELLAAVHPPTVVQAVLVEPVGPVGDAPAAAATGGRLPVPVFLAVSPQTALHPLSAAPPGRAGDGVVRRVYPTWVGASACAADFVEDLLDFIGTVPPREQQ